MITEDEFLKLCKLSKLSFSDNEKKSFLEKMNDVLVWIETMKEVDVSGISLNDADTISTPERDDVVISEDLKSDILSNAKSHNFGMFSVPKIVE